MKRGRLVLLLVFAAGIAGLTATAVVSGTLETSLGWGLVSFIIAALAIVAIFLEFQSTTIGSKEVALVAMLGTISAAVRIPFAALPSVQPCTFLIICTGYVFGPVAGFMVGALTPLVSNFYLGHGPWTPFQMLAWGMLGVMGAGLGRLRAGTLGLIALGVVGAFIYGWTLNTWYWASFIYPLTFKTFLVYQLNSVWFDAFHAAGNIVFFALFGAKTIVIMERFRKRFNWRVLAGKAATERGIAAPQAQLETEVWRGPQSGSAPSATPSTRFPQPFP